MSEELVPTTDTPAVAEQQSVEPQSVSTILQQQAWGDIPPVQPQVEEKKDIPDTPAIQAATGGEDEETFDENIYLKNNIKALQETKTDSGRKKIDHLKGKLVDEDGGDWKLSLMGTNAKDVSDAHCSACYSCINEFKGIPSCQFEDINEEEDAVDQQNEKMKKAVLQSIYEKYSYQISTTNH